LQTDARLKAEYGFTEAGDGHGNACVNGCEVSILPYLLTLRYFVLFTEFTEAVNETTLTV